jgi:hypothetical protein
MDDLEGQFQGPLPILSGNPGRFPVLHALEKGLNLTLKGIDFFDGDLLNENLG